MGARWSRVYFTIPSSLFSTQEPKWIKKKLWVCASRLKTIRFYHEKKNKIQLLAWPSKPPLVFPCLLLSLSTLTQCSWRSTSPRAAPQKCQALFCSRATPQLLVEPGILSPQFFAHPWSLSLKEDILDSLPLIRLSFIFSSSTLIFLHAFYYSLQSRYDDYALDMGLCHLIASFFRAVISPSVHMSYHGAWMIDVQSRHLPNCGFSKERRKARR